MKSIVGSTILGLHISAMMSDKSKIENLTALFCFLLLFREKRQLNFD